MASSNTSLRFSAPDGRHMSLDVGVGCSVTIINNAITPVGTERDFDMRKELDDVKSLLETTKAQLAESDRKREEAESQVGEIKKDYVVLKIKYDEAIRFTESQLKQHARRNVTEINAHLSVMQESDDEEDIDLLTPRSNASSRKTKQLPSRSDKSSDKSQPRKAARTSMESRTRHNDNKPQSTTKKSRSTCVASAKPLSAHAGDNLKIACANCYTTWTSANWHRGKNDERLCNKCHSFEYRTGKSWPAGLIARPKQSRLGGNQSSDTEASDDEDIDLLTPRSNSSSQKRKRVIFEEDIDDDKTQSNTDRPKKAAKVLSEKTSDCKAFARKCQASHVSKKAVCTNRGSTQTSTNGWRRNQAGQRVCYACYHREWRNKKPEPVKRPRANKSATQSGGGKTCMNCGTSSHPRYTRISTGDLNCGRCYVYYHMYQRARPSYLFSNSACDGKEHCANAKCQTESTNKWYTNKYFPDSNQKRVCSACYRYYLLHKKARPCT